MFCLYKSYIKNRSFCKSFLFLLLFTLSAQMNAQLQTFKSGSYIINMGITPQTKANGLKPYGLVYDMIVNYKVPVIWSINPAKIKDGTDFTYNAVNYKGGPFIIPSEYITSAVKTRIASWVTLGVQGVYAIADFSAPVYDTLSATPKVMIDMGSGKNQIIEDYYVNAGIPSTAYTLAVPSDLTNCYDLWSNPHDDPTWASHKNLYTFACSYKGNIWCECHEVSVMESCKNPVSPFEQLNFLTSKGLQCYQNNGCNGIGESHSGNADLSTVTYNYPADPMMQFMSTFTNATQNGSEDWYIPLSTGKWNNLTKRAVTTNDGSTPKEGVLLAYGPAYGNTSYGTVVYEAGHNLDGSGTTDEKVAAQRCYFNFLLYSTIKKKLAFTTSIPTYIIPGSTVPVSVTVTSGTGSPPYTYKWTSRLGGTFANSTASTTTYTAPNLHTDTSDVITITVTDACGRTNFNATYSRESSGILPVSLIEYHAKLINYAVFNTWSTASEFNNDYFTIERSKDAVQFENIGVVDGAGNSNTVRNYSFIDTNPYAGDSYYRLKQTDFDKKVTYSRIATISNEEGNKSSVIISPNPASGIATITFTDLQDKNITVQVYDVFGRIVINKDIKLNDSNNQVNLDFTNVAKGEYFLFYNYDNVSKFKRFSIN